MHIAHVALWTRSLNARVQFWETVFNGRSNERYVSKNRPGFESHFITLDDGPTIELMTLPELPNAPQPRSLSAGRISPSTSAARQKWTAWPSEPGPTARCSALRA